MTATSSGTRFVERVVAVTGAGSGIGAAIASAFAGEGAKVAVIDLNRDAASSVADGLKGSSAYQCDVAESDAVNRTIDAIVSRYGQLDVAVNCAGIAGSREAVRRRSAALEAYTAELVETMQPPRSPIDITVGMSDEEWRQMFAVHVDGTFYVTRRALQHMLPRGSGAIVNISSICGILGCVGTPSYSAAKAAIIGFTRSVGREVANRGIRVNAVAPGYIDTNLSPDRSSTERALTIAQIPQGRLGSVAEVAASVLFLASDDASYYVGSTFTPSGGVVMT